MADLPLFERPVFSFKKHTLSQHVLVDIWSELERYHEFLFGCLMHSQRSWANAVRDQQHIFDDALLKDFESYACMNDPARGDPLEKIKATNAYVYLPTDAANNCLERQSLQPIPDYMCSGEGESKRIVAVIIPPNQSASSKREIVNIYHRHGCGAVDADDIQRCLVIPRTDLMSGDDAVCVYGRHRSPYDVIADVPVLFA